MTPLEAEIRRIIAVEGPMPLAQFMALALAHPVHGYYVTRDPFGARGDFITSPEISQMFGELIGLWAAAVWNEMGRPDRVHLVELGPGRGTLMADALRAVKVAENFRAALAVDLVEPSPAVRAADGWHERMVGVGVDEKLVLALHPDPILNFSAMLPKNLSAAPVGAVFEWRSDALVTEVAGRLARRGGAALIIDYGHAES